MTMTSLFDIDEIVADLVDDGDEHVVETETGTWTFKLRLEPDDLEPNDIEDDEVFGRYECRDYRDPDRNRPQGFTGAAVKFDSQSSQGIYFWYEPPKDFRKFKGSGYSTVDDWEFAKAKNLIYVRNLLSWGYIQIGVEVRHVRTDGYHHEWSEWSGGVESGIGLWGEELTQHGNYVAEIVRDLLDELIRQVEGDGDD